MTKNVCTKFHKNPTTFSLILSGGRTNQQTWSQNKSFFLLPKEILRNIFLSKLRYGRLYCCSENKIYVALLSVQLLTAPSFLMAANVSVGKGPRRARGQRRRLADFCLNDFSVFLTKMHLTALHGKTVQSNQMENCITRKTDRFLIVSIIPSIYT